MCQIKRKHIPRDLGSGLLGHQWHQAYAVYRMVSKARQAALLLLARHRLSHTSDEAIRLAVHRRQAVGHTRLPEEDSFQLRAVRGKVSRPWLSLLRRAKSDKGRSATSRLLPSASALACLRKGTGYEKRMPVQLNLVPCKFDQHQEAACLSVTRPPSARLDHQGRTI